MTEEDFAKAITDVRDSLVQVWKEAMQTHGPAAAMTGMVAFAATAVHQAEHIMQNPQARQIVLGQFCSHFHAYLDLLNEQCDEVENFPKPEGQA